MFSLRLLLFALISHSITAIDQPNSSNDHAKLGSSVEEDDGYPENLVFEHLVDGITNVLSEEQGFDPQKLRLAIRKLVQEMPMGRDNQDLKKDELLRLVEEVKTDDNLARKFPHQLIWKSVLEEEVGKYIKLHYPESAADPATEAAKTTETTKNAATTTTPTTTSATATTTSTTPNTTSTTPTTASTTPTTTSTTPTTTSTTPTSAITTPTTTSTTPTPSTAILTTTTTIRTARTTTKSKTTRPALIHERVNVGKCWSVDHICFRDLNCNSKKNKGSKKKTNMARFKTHSGDLSFCALVVIKKESAAKLHIDLQTPYGSILSINYNGNRSIEFKPLSDLVTCNPDCEVKASSPLATKDENGGIYHKSAVITLILEDEPKNSKQAGFEPNDAGATGKEEGVTAYQRSLNKRAEHIQEMVSRGEKRSGSSSGKAFARKLSDERTPLVSTPKPPTPMTDLSPKKAQSLIKSVAGSAPDSAPSSIGNSRDVDTTQ